MSSPADAAARRQAAVVAAANMESLAGYPQAVVTDPVLDAWRAQFASQAAAAFQGSPMGAMAHATAPGLLPPGAVGGLMGAGGLHGLLQPMPAAMALLAPPSGSGDSKNWEEAKKEAKSSAEEASTDRLRLSKEDRAKKEADAAAEAERRKCHLHKKPNGKCKFCQVYKDFVAKENEAKAVAKEKFTDSLKGKMVRASEQGHTSGPLELVNNKNYGFPKILHTHVVESTHFKTLLDFQSIEEITHEIVGYADTVEPYVQNSTTVPSALFCCVYRLLTMNLTGGQLKRLLESEDSPLIRCAGFVAIRFGLPPEHIWNWFGEYILDDQEVPVGKGGGNTTIGEYVEGMMTQDHYFSTVLPRLPNVVKRHMESKLAQVSQERRRSKANRRVLDLFRERGARVEACVGDSEWRAGEVLEVLADTGTFASRPKVRVRFEHVAEGEREESLVHLGRVILADGGRSRRGGGGRGRSRSRSPVAGGVDWSREKGKSSQELLEERRRTEQDRAVCSSGKEYSRRPVSFQVASVMEQGSHSKNLVRNEEGEERRRSGGSGGGSGGQRQDPRDSSPDFEEKKRKREQDAEYQGRMKQLFEKYGTAKSASSDASRRSDIEGPDVMRFG
mmetsp:Transcript_42564/g.121793  ORF Transcript_42564/g.121793 Transcript_42564/m.121793 type:complete len:616 (-) Transcript_42564:22-1869(-)|eukprot:CAMPEP_0177268474 /NCGR_PEP_ID=MMETSP0367-20130122/63832_1 /TAXON_ID=447022 ORGANISM="Scrippsiella hangoei-like, Strain SHHI-4" /NCGR_SAMPLE_ID=MMETSP0367 /ASSEMBLY_ACC=CAM_ASM_000362 /LENGTH=615 /DNA_ID=CAMNT_0018724103 /DNA_START=73 /DNA_END=1920 /DNA_ORIENTATION=+